MIPTFRQAAALVHEEHEKAWKNCKHQNQWITTLKTYAFPKMGDLLVSEIEGPLIRDVLAPIWLAKPELHGASANVSEPLSTGRMREDSAPQRHR